MRVAFTCEECGRDLLIYHPTDLHRPTFDAAECDLGTVITQLTCPNCAKLTYGPLTEEMLVDALIECSHSHDEVEDDYYECEARFVLRVLNEANENDDLYSGPGGYNPKFVNWRDRLLDLARQK